MCFSQKKHCVEKEINISLKYMNNSLVSVVIPTYNRQDSILKAIESVLNQSYTNVEVIIVDDCSTDKTEEIVNKKYCTNSRVKYFCLQTNSGACVARNEGVRQSSGEYIAFLDSDDYYLPQKVEKQIEMLQRTSADLCVSDFIRQDKDGNEGIIKMFDGSRNEIYFQLLYCNYMTTGTLLGKKNCFIETPFDEELPRYQDWDLVLRLCQKYKFTSLHENTLVQIYQPVSITASTNHAKTLKALSIVYNKNIEGYKRDKLAFTQIHWLMGLHNLYLNKKQAYKDLWIGVTHNGFNMKRFIIFVYARLGFIKLVSNNI